MNLSVRTGFETSTGWISNANNGSHVTAHAIACAVTSAKTSNSQTAAKHESRNKQIASLGRPSIYLRTLFAQVAAQNVCTFSGPGRAACLELRNSQGADSVGLVHRRRQRGHKRGQRYAHRVECVA